MQAAADVSTRCKELGSNALHIKIRARGGTGQKTPYQGGQAAIRALARAGIKIGRIEDSGVRQLDESYRPEMLSLPPQLTTISSASAPWIMVVTNLQCHDKVTIMS